MKDTITNKQNTNKQLQTNEFLKETYNSVKNYSGKYAQEDYSKEIGRRKKMIRNTFVRLDIPNKFSAIWNQIYKSMNVLHGG